MKVLTRRGSHASLNRFGPCSSHSWFTSLNQQQTQPRVHTRVGVYEYALADVKRKVHGVSHRHALQALLGRSRPAGGTAYAWKFKNSGNGPLGTCVLTANVTLRPQGDSVPKENLSATDEHLLQSTRGLGRVSPVSTQTVEECKTPLNKSSFLVYTVRVGIVTGLRFCKERSLIFF